MALTPDPYSYQSYAYKPSSDFFTPTDTGYSWSDAANWKPPADLYTGKLSKSFADYWNPKGDTAGYSWSDAVKWNPGKDFLSGFLENKGGRPGYYQSEGEQSSRYPFGQMGGGSSGFSGNLFPGFSAIQPESAKVVAQVAPVPGGESPWAPVAGIATGLVGSFLGPIAGAAGGALAKSIFH